MIFFFVLLFQGVLPFRPYFNEGLTTVFKEKNQVIVKISFAELLNPYDKLQEKSNFLIKQKSTLDHLLSYANDCPVHKKDKNVDIPLYPFQDKTLSRKKRWANEITLVSGEKTKLRSLTPIGCNIKNVRSKRFHTCMLRMILKVKKPVTHFMGNIFINFVLKGLKATTLTNSVVTLQKYFTAFEISHSYFLRLITAWSKGTQNIVHTFNSTSGLLIMLMHASLLFKNYRGKKSATNFKETTWLDLDKIPSRLLIAYV